MKLYELADELERALANPEVMDPETGELLDPARLDALQMSMDAKALNVALYILGEEREAEAVQREVTRLTDRRRVHENRAKWLRAYLAGFYANGDKFRDARVSVAIGQTISLDVLDAEKVADVWKVQPPAPPQRIDKIEALKAIKSGVQIEGLALKATPKVTIR